ncbi:unnamed protein product [marine sediment metagenome]|uniref:Uncharacterized protein n=1 Tax=marine sediment metagenome TaxID=412755 RepID=X1B6F3_9ZZZZ
MRKRSRKLAIKLPDSDTIGLKFIKRLIPTLSKKKLYATLGKVQSYPEGKEKTEILEMLKKEFEKRNIDYLW